jgi:hypothetical protein
MTLANYPNCGKPKSYISNIEGLLFDLMFELIEYETNCNLNKEINLPKAFIIYSA